MLRAVRVPCSHLLEIQPGARGGESWRATNKGDGDVNPFLGKEPMRPGALGGRGHGVVLFGLGF